MEWVLSIRAEWLTPIMKFFTFLGDEEFFLLFLAQRSYGSCWDGSTFHICP